MNNSTPTGFLPIILLIEYPGKFRLQSFVNTLIYFLLQIQRIRLIYPRLKLGTAPSFGESPS